MSESIVTEAVPYAHMHPAPQPKERILDVYGAFGRRVGGWMPIADLIRLMALFGVDEQAVRAATSRMKRNGLLIAQRHGRVAGYRLSDETLELLHDGDQRIFRPVADDSATHDWTLAIFSVPESHRDRRYLIRSRLSRLGFGQVTSGVMVAPKNFFVEAEHMLRRTHLAQFVNLWEATLGNAEDEHALIERAWDLDAVEAAYREFIAAFEPVVRRWRKRTHGGNEEAFVDYVEALSNWRHLAYLDPGLPRDLLPSKWPGARARALFLKMVQRLEEPAFRHFLSVIEASAKVANS